MEGEATEYITEGLLEMASDKISRTNLFEKQYKIIFPEKRIGRPIKSSCLEMRRSGTQMVPRKATYWERYYTGIREFRE